MRQANEREHTDHIRHQYVNPTLLFCNGFCLVCSAKVLVCNGFFWFVVPKFWFVMVLGVFFPKPLQTTKNHFKPKKTITNRATNQNFGTTNHRKPLQTKTLARKTITNQNSGTANHYKPQETITNQNRKSLQTKTPWTNHATNQKKPLRTNCSMFSKIVVIVLGPNRACSKKDTWG